MKRLRPVLILSLLTAAAWSAQPRVFYSPAERAAITVDRRKLSQELLAETSGQTSVVVALPAIPAESQVVAAPPVAARLDGISLSQDGKAYAWINGRRYEDGNLYGGKKLQVSSNGIRLQGGASRLVRVGEAIP